MVSAQNNDSCSRAVVLVPKVERLPTDAKEVLDPLL